MNLLIRQFSLDSNLVYTMYGYGVNVTPYTHCLNWLLAHTAPKAPALSWRINDL
jgi:hypothetical protein